MNIDLELDLTDWNAIVKMFHEETDRGAAVLAGSYLDNYLGVYLFSLVRDEKIGERLFGTNGPLSTFSQKTDCAYAFGFISRNFHSDINYIRKIRNHFAHHPRSASFDESPAKDWVDELTFSKGFLVGDGSIRKMETRRLTYLVSVGAIAGQLYMKIKNSNDQGNNISPSLP